MSRALARALLAGVAASALLAPAACRSEGAVTATASAPAPATARDVPPAAAPVAPAEPAAAAREARPRVVLESALGEVSVDVELALTPPTRTRGLMFRRRLEPYRGMLFIFPDAKRQSFWMKNTPLALDMIFIDSSGVVVGVVDSAEPYSLTPRGVDAPCRFVLEVGAGWARAHGVAAGTKVRLVDVPVATAR